jgi:hypothetical protein
MEMLPPGERMPERDALAGLRQALAAIDVVIRSGRSDPGRLAELAREARRYSETIAQMRQTDDPAAPRQAALEDQPAP